jgi:hypothetical protein
MLQWLWSPARLRTYTRYLCVLSSSESGPGRTCRPACAQRKTSVAATVRKGFFLKPRTFPAFDYKKKRSTCTRGATTVHCPRSMGQDSLKNKSDYSLIFRPTKAARCFAPACIHRAASSLISLTSHGLSSPCHRILSRSVLSRWSSRRVLLGSEPLSSLSPCCLSSAHDTKPPLFYHVSSGWGGNAAI